MLRRSLSGANSNSLQRGDCCPLDPGRYWDWYPSQYATFQTTPSGARVKVYLFSFTCFRSSFSLFLLRFLSFVFLLFLGAIWYWHWHPSQLAPAGLGACSFLLFSRFPFFVFPSLF